MTSMPELPTGAMDYLRKNISDETRWKIYSRFFLFWALLTAVTAATATASLLLDIPEWIPILILIVTSFYTALSGPIHGLAGLNVTTAEPAPDPVFLPIGDDPVAVDDEADVP